MAIIHRKFATAAVLFLCAVAEGGFPNILPTQGEPWPMPREIHLTNKSLLIAMPDRLQFDLVGEQCSDLWEAVVRYQNIISGLAQQPHGRRKRQGRLKEFGELEVSTELTGVTVNVTSPCQDRLVPKFDMDESYSIEIDPQDTGSQIASIRADSLWGSLRALETFVQLMFSNRQGGLYIRQGQVKDSPRYSHRGVLLDTSRHFIYKKTILEFLDLMAINKFNVFHWHIVDDQSFPFVSISYPSIHEGGAYDTDLVYEPQDVEEVIEYARKRGIRVIPEFDTPGHTRSWGEGLPGFLTTCYGDDGKPNGEFGPIDPSNSDVYTFLDGFLQEIVMRFEDKYLHLGGDEVSFGFDCWLSNPDIQAWMSQLNITTPEEVESAYIQQLLTLVEALPTSPEYVVWQEVIDNNIPVKPATIVEVWKDGWEDEMSKVTNQSLRAILSSCWYLNDISYGADWQQYYKCEPESFNGTDEQNQLVIGGEACMWGEFVDDTNVIPRTWPRASAVAERLWSPKDTTYTDHTQNRIEEHRCRMLNRGHNAQPPNGPGFC